MRLLYSLVIAATAPLLSAATCESLASLQLPNTTVTAAESHMAGPFAPPAGQPVRVAVDFCRVTLTLRPSSDSDIRTEVWMPAANWNGKFQGIGSGGFAGAISYEGGLAPAVSAGYAAASTDTGHRAGETDAAWALDHPEKIADFGYRAIHETALAAKTVIRAFYGDGPKHSYFNYCSNGGRQALMEAQRYPADYDGIVAGAPAYAWTRLMTTFVFDAQALADQASYIPVSKLPAVEAATLAACDANDGVKDSVIENPASCHFDPGALLCKGGESDACLTAPQVASLRKLYAGPGAAIMPGFSPGGEAPPGRWETWMTGARPGDSRHLAFGDNFFKYMVYDDPSWDYKTSSLERNLQASEAKTGSRLNATDADLSQFRARGGKLICFTDGATRLFRRNRQSTTTRASCEKWAPRTRRASFGYSWPRASGTAMEARVRMSSGNSVLPPPTPITTLTRPWNAGSNKESRPSASSLRSSRAAQIGPAASNAHGHYAVTRRPRIGPATAARTMQPTSFASRPASG
jgi:hypothetical protein